MCAHLLAPPLLPLPPYSGTPPPPPSRILLPPPLLPFLSFLCSLLLAQVRARAHSAKKNGPSLTLYLPSLPQTLSSFLPLSTSLSPWRARANCAHTFNCSVYPPPSFPFSHSLPLAEGAHARALALTPPPCSPPSFLFIYSTIHVSLIFLHVCFALPFALCGWWRCCFSLTKENLRLPGGGNRRGE